MMPTFTQIGSAVTVGAGGASSIDFTSIPSTYTDLIVKISARSSTTGNAWQDLFMSLNSSSSSFTFRNLYAVPSSVYSDSGSTNLQGWIDGASATASTFGTTEIYIPNYAGSTNKSISVDTAIETNATANLLGFTASLWAATPAAITSISLTPVSGTFVQYSTAYLYGVSNA